MTLSNLRKLTRIIPLILASSSPRRSDLLESHQLAFTRAAPRIDETQKAGEPPAIYAIRLAEQKALSVSSEISENPSPVVLGCDTVVLLENRILGKPVDDTEAVRILTNLSGKKHMVSTAVALAYGDRILRSGIDSTQVWFNEVSAKQIDEYVATKEGRDKAGAYGIQGMGSFLVDRIEGELDTVIGLPCALLDRLAGEIVQNADELFVKEK